MRALIQRVKWASVTIEGREKSRIEGGLLVFLGVEPADGEEDLRWLVNKVCALRVFDDAEGVMNRSLVDVGGSMLVVSQFTLMASTKKGNRPSYIRAARPEVAVPLYEAFVRAAEEQLCGRVKTGEFGADMKVELLNDGPVTIWIDTKNKE